MDVSAKRQEKESQKDNKNKKWNKQQQENCQRFGDIYRQEPYNWNVDIEPSVANEPLQQHVQLPAIQPYKLPAPPAIAAPLPIPLIVITPLLQLITPDGCKRPLLKAIPDEDEPPEPRKKDLRTYFF
jgi:hypothetical protein